MTSLILGHVTIFSEFISTFNSLITKFTSLPNHQTYILADDDVTAIRSRGIHLWLYLQFYYQQVMRSHKTQRSTAVTLPCFKLNWNLKKNCGRTSLVKANSLLGTRKNSRCVHSVINTLFQYVQLLQKLDGRVASNTLSP